jgi:hypothetical protein
MAPYGGKLVSQIPPPASPTVWFGRRALESALHALWSEIHSPAGVAGLLPKCF